MYSRDEIRIVNGETPLNKTPLLLMSAATLALLTACGGSPQTESSEATSTSASVSASASATPTASPSPSVEPTTEAPAPEATETPATEESPAEETPTEEPTPADPFPGTTFAENGVAFFVPEGYTQDASPSQPEIFIYQFTHYETAEEALGRFMVGTPYANPDQRQAKEVEKELIERLRSAWSIKEVGATESYTREDGVQVVRTQVRFASGGNPGYLFTYSNGIELMHSAILLEEENAEFMKKIEDSIAFAW